MYIGFYVSMFICLYVYMYRFNVGAAKSFSNARISTAMRTCATKYP